VVLSVYLAALVAALGALGVQLGFGHHGVGGVGDASHGGADHDASAWSLIASLRFWCFALLAFGLVGSALTLFHLAGTVAVAGLAIASGLGSGFFAATVISKLAARPSSSHATTGDAIGRIGRVIVPLVPGGRGKVRVEIKGAFVDYSARARETVAVEETVIVEECDGSEVLVSRAPKELKE
jgi:membrane protein implicated in regulation of membrane protease activity